MQNKLALAVLACLAMTGCSYLGISDSTSPTSSTASAAAMPTGLVRVPQSTLVGRPVHTTTMRDPHSVGYVLVDPNRRVSR